MKIITTKGTFELEQPNIEPITLGVQVAAAIGEFSKLIPFFFDSGVTGETLAVIPVALLKELEIELPILDRGSGELADGSLTTDEVISLASLRIKTIPSGQSIILQDVRVSVSKTASEPLINLEPFFNVFTKAGEMALLELAR